MHAGEDELRVGKPGVGRAWRPGMMVGQLGDRCGVAVV
jgi:hypothetical protein